MTIHTRPAPLIRPYRQCDRDAVVAIDEQSGRERMGLAGLQQHWNLQHARIRVIKPREQNQGAVAGFIAYREQADSTGAYVVIDRLAVHPDQRRRGLGRDLLHNIVLSHVHLWRGVLAEVSEINLPAARLLQQAGFRCTAIRRAAGVDGEDRLRFWRRPPETEEIPGRTRSGEGENPCGAS